MHGRFTIAFHTRCNRENENRRPFEHLHRFEAVEEVTHQRAFRRAQYAFIRFDRAAFCSADIGFRRRRLGTGRAVDAVGRAAPRFRSGNAL